MHPRWSGWPRLSSTTQTFKLSCAWCRLSLASLSMRRCTSTCPQHGPTRSQTCWCLSLLHSLPCAPGGCTMHFSACRLQRPIIKVSKPGTHCKLASVHCRYLLPGEELVMHAKLRIPASWQSTSASVQTELSIKFDYNEAYCTGAWWT
jgi:hypothetical protein